MPYLQVNDKQVQLRLGETRIGVGPHVDLRLPSAATAGEGGALAIVEVGRDSIAIRRAGPETVVRVNGVQLGAEPTPLIHGDKIEVGGAELYYGDDRRGGSTQFIPAANIADAGRSRSPVPGRATAATGGRVISLVDGREYAVSAAGLVFGRDAACDVVIPSSEVSRRHAEIIAGENGYVVTDTSTNGLFVNGERVEGVQILGRGDIVRIGTEEFRFYADAMPAAGVMGQSFRAVGSASAAGAPLAARESSAPGAGVSAPPLMSATPQAVAQPGSPASARAPASTPPSAAAPNATPNAAPAGMPRGALATLEVVGSGILRGQQFPVMAILAHVGRGEHNDVIIPEESVSDSHAKLQRRDGAWYVTDLGSTNGTYVAGRRIESEERLGLSADLRFGGVKLAFTALAAEPVTGPRGATREFSAAFGADHARPGAPSRPVAHAERAAAASAAPVRVAPARRDAGPQGPQGVSGAPPARAAAGRGARWLWWVVGVAAALGAAVYFIKGR